MLKIKDSIADITLQQVRLGPDSSRAGATAAAKNAPS
jgi:hypothetical protein